MSEHEGLGDVAQLDPLIHAPARLLIMAILTAVASADFLYLLRETELTRGLRPLQRVFGKVLQ